ncbi:hypothetical protein TUMSATVNIG1_52230 [Vibrio nigripulchritudo]|uniref:Lcl C-terminal domain-containing protein n=1 Tax=Vibrio nigripulchritudo TaxID=28173 RepID=UPI00190A49C5|nr:DUF1566 domain-containing protein [Vibrio nigripulchritudo]BCL73250.1 hypothetical protein VNTUMSATTG_51870 [Vibrio nigripulchritudo]BDU34614.1 hypothetical protein TUMSATVNIG1_52230 [Vibrio nigripulchritudo]
MKKFMLTMLLTLTSSGAMAQICAADITKSAPNSRFVAEDNGTVKDLKTGLVWMRCPLGKTWNNASGSCSGENLGTQWQTILNEVADINSKPLHKLHKFAGYEDWRLPNAKELFSLIEKSCIKPALNTKAFPNFMPADSFSTTSSLWSSTAAGSGDAALVMDARFGDVLTQLPNKSGGNYGALLVTDSK